MMLNSKSSANWSRDEARLPASDEAGIGGYFNSSLLFTFLGRSFCTCTILLASVHIVFNCPPLPLSSSQHDQVRSNNTLPVPPRLQFCVAPHLLSEHGAAISPIASRLREAQKAGG